VDCRSDLFALGLVLFECLTGRRAFHGATPVETAANLLHVHPPPPSSLRAGLTDAHDELCRRLLAKDPADRFQSAEEVVGAIRVLLPDTSRTSAELQARLSPVRPVWRLSAAAWAIGIVILAGVSASVWTWTHGRALPAVPEESDVWYRRGSEAVREGAYYRAKKALEQAVAVYPQHALAYARLAEVAAELDDPSAASEHLVRVSQLALNESRLPKPEQLRLQAVRALVLRDVDRAVARYRSLVSETQSDPRALVDLGRAQEAAGRRTDARTSYEQAVAADPQYAAAHLRRGILEGLDSRWEPALAAFAEAERLYKASSDVEGETEVLLHRGEVLDQKGEPHSARRDLERALQLASNSKSTYQTIQAQLALSIVIAGEGRIADAERLAGEAVKEALANGLDAVAARGLVDLAGTLLFADKLSEAEKQLQLALQLAERRGATLTGARTKIQLAEVYARGARTEEGLALIDEVLPMLQKGQHRRHELSALSVGARARERSGDLAEARRMASKALALADAISDERQAATAAASLASVSTVLGALPEALGLRERADAIHRRQGDKALLPYDLTNRADLLIRLGRGEEASTLLSELEAGIAAGLESYTGRRRRAVFLRAFHATTLLRCGSALPLLDAVVANTSANDSAAVLAPALQRFCSAVTRIRPGPVPALPPDPDKPATRERQYWLAAAALRAGDAAAATAEAERGLTLLGDTENHELRWRLGAVGSMAARQRGDAANAARYAGITRDAMGHLRTTWKTDFDTYQRRPDLADLIGKKEQQ
jgi:tetratricopeptide (TPR) repeat protein